MHYGIVSRNSVYSIKPSPIGNYRSFYSVVSPGRKVSGPVATFRLDRRTEVVIRWHVLSCDTIICVVGKFTNEIFNPVRSGTSFYSGNWISIFTYHYRWALSIMEIRKGRFDESIFKSARRRRSSWQQWSRPKCYHS